MRIAVGVITRRRPQEFCALLARLATQDTPTGTELHFIFVENDKTNSAGQFVYDFKSTLGSENVYLELETKIGIPFARNHVLDIAYRINADWLAWIDDDDLPTTNDWICKLYQGCRTSNLTAGYGVNIYPDSRKPSTHKLLYQGSNVMFDMAFLRASGIRYNINLPVGEDVQFGRECMAKEAKIETVMDAVVQVGDGGRFDNPYFRFRRAMDEGMVKYGFHFRRLYVSNFHPVKTPIGITIKVVTAILNLVLAILFVPSAKIRASRHAGIVAGVVKGCLPRYRQVSL